MGYINGAAYRVYESKALITSSLGGDWNSRGGARITGIRTTEQNLRITKVSNVPKPKRMKKGTAVKGNQSKRGSGSPHPTTLAPRIVEALDFAPLSHTFCPSFGRLRIRRGYE